MTRRLCSWLIHLLETFDDHLVALDDDVNPVVEPVALAMPAPS